MPKLKSKKILAPEKQFLAFPDHYVNLPGKIAFAELAKLATTDADTYGEKSGKVIARGTLVYMDADGVQVSYEGKLLHDIRELMCQVEQRICNLEIKVEQVERAQEMLEESIAYINKYIVEQR